MPPKMFINDADTPGFQDRQADFVMLIHFAKCKRGDQCPIPSCRGTSVSTKRMLIDAFQTSALGTHYAKCRAQATNIITRGACNCGILRFGLQGLHERFFSSETAFIGIGGSMCTSVQPEPYLSPNGRDNNYSEVCSNQGPETMESISVCERKSTSKYSRWFEKYNDYSCDDGALRLIAFSARRTLFRLYNIQWRL